MKLFGKYLTVAVAALLLAGGMILLLRCGVITVYDAVAVGSDAPAEAANPKLANVLRRAIGGAQTVGEPTELPEPIPLTAFSSGRAVNEYLLYAVRMMDRRGYLLDVNRDRWYRLSASGFTELLSDPSFGDLTAGEPSLSLTLTDDAANTILIGKEVQKDLYLCAADGSFRAVTEKSESSAQPPTVLRDLPLRPQAEPLPDRWDLLCYREEELLIAQKGVSAEELYFPAQPGTYTYILTPVWDLSPDRDWYGEVTYEFSFSVQA